MIWCSVLSAQNVKEYIVKKTNTPIIIDGKMIEPEWKEAKLTDSFVQQESGDSVKWNTQAKLLWDEQYLYIGFIADDPDVWSTYTERDANLWEQENVEIFCEPNDDEKDYFELEVSPLGTELDILIDRSWIEGSNNEDFGWNLAGLKTAVWVDGTLNNPQDIDNGWYCEIAIPFANIDSLIVKPLNIPPQAGDLWRFQLARYNRIRDNEGNEINPQNPETSLWNKTDSEWFHVPAKFGRILFSDEIVTTVNSSDSESQFSKDYILIENFPNPFNPSTTIQYSIPNTAGNEKFSFIQLKVYDILGREVASLVDKKQKPGDYIVKFDASNLTSGIYLYRIQADEFSDTKKMLLLK